MFGFLAPLHKAGLPSSPLQSHLRQLDNLTSFCDNILAVYFSSDHPCKIAAHAGNTLCGAFTETTNIIFCTLVLLTYFFLLWVFFLLLVRALTQLPSPSLSAFYLFFFFYRCSLASSLCRSSPSCTGHSGCQPPEINSACKQRVQFDRKGASAFLSSSFAWVHGCFRQVPSQLCLW